MASIELKPLSLDNTKQQSDAYKEAVSLRFNRLRPSTLKSFRWSRFL